MLLCAEKRSICRTQQPQLTYYNTLRRSMVARGASWVMVEDRNSQHSTDFTYDELVLVADHPFC
jgi:hypothetical protein